MGCFGEMISFYLSLQLGRHCSGKGLYSVRGHSIFLLELSSTLNRLSRTPGPAIVRV